MWALVRGSLSDIPLRQHPCTKKRPMDWRDGKTDFFFMLTYPYSSFWRLFVELLVYR